MNSKAALTQLIECALLEEIITEEDLMNVCASISMPPSLETPDIYPPFNPNIPQANMSQEQAMGSGYYRGQIKSFSEMDGYGFISNNELKLKYGGDIFLHKNQFFSSTTDLNIGDYVFFKLEVNPSGKPQARDIIPIIQ